MLAAATLQVSPARARRMAVVRAIAVVAALLLALFARPAVAFTPPPLTGHVVDTAGKLGPDDVRYLDAKLERIRRQTGFEIVAFVAGSLEGETIEDVAYTAFNAWGIGREGEDNGVLLVIDPVGRRIRIETGKGVGGALTDLQSNDIIRRTIRPLLQQERFRDAIDQGTVAIAQTLVKGTPGAERPDGTGPAPPGARRPSPLSFGIGAVALVLTILLAAVSPAFRMFLWFVLQAILFGGRGGGGGDSGYRGGGGRSGGGGSSDSY